MIEIEFFQEYRTRLESLSDSYKLEIDISKESKKENFTSRTDWLKQQIIKSSIDFISEILIENGESPEFKVVQTSKNGVAKVDIASSLIPRVSSIKMEIVRDFDLYVDLANSRLFPDQS